MTSEELTAIRPADRARMVLNLTNRPRRGYRGPGVPGWCSTHGLPLPDRVNTLVNAGGLIVARLGQTEILILPEADAPLVLPVPVEGVFDAYRDEGWLWFRLCGADTRLALASLTDVDLRVTAAPAGSVRQTRVAGLDAVLAIHGEGEATCIDLFADVASAVYLAAAFGDRCPGFQIQREADNGYVPL